jgi:hypothetical protein
MNFHTERRVNKVPGFSPYWGGASRFVLPVLAECVIDASVKSLWEKSLRPER